MQGIIAFILIFFVVVTIHEFGHFIVAKKSGILCQEFAIGMGPKIFHKKIGETNFTIRLLPLGGYVKMPDNVFDFNNDVSMYDLKKGMNIRLKLDKEDKVEKIILDESNDMELLPIHLEDFDLTEKLFIRGFVGDESEYFKVRKDACVVFGGMEEQIAPLERMFSSHSWGKKFWTLFAGPLMNFFLAAVIFIGLAFYTGVPVNNDDAKLGVVADNSPAQTAGLKVGDTITEVNGQSVSTWTGFVEKIKESNGQELTLKVNRDGSIQEVKVTPKEEVTKNKKGEDVKTYKVGIGKYQETKKGFVDSIKYGLQETLHYGTLIFTAIINLFVSLFTGGFSLNQLGGPVAIYEMSSSAAKSGLVTTLQWTGILSVNLGLMNLIPIPVLDGGRIIFVIYEAIFKKPINKKAQYYMTITFGLLMVALMLAVTWNDIQRLFGK
ncbi:RIP metalloprotease RseP [Gemella sanguinis M325]|jgi:RIP metalloprotease rseP|uniref:Zinc metalloprotease n=1 Tax=Gemella sanguinis TaxID=84135 RepID=A0ABX6FHR1_9BACL|nr:RIP metalloprotease RseP [Gemella sanguinis]EGF86875.1 RIP metalloprotease RseP [Gemella sanguinis M325]QGS08043.1 RIP metalloprotease RseP [Gemella sanguinis]